MDKPENSLAEGLERLGLIASRIRKSGDSVPQIEIDIILEELRNLYMMALQMEKRTLQKSEPGVLELDMVAAREKAEADYRQAEEAAARKATEEKRQAEEAAARKSAEERRQAEEAAAHKAAEERRQADEAAARKAAEEGKRKAAEAAIAAAELNPVFAPEEPTKVETPMIESQLEELAGNPNEGLFANEPIATKKEKKKETSLFDYISKEQGGQAKRTLADTLSHPAHNIEEQLDSRVRARKVDDLRTIININDKFSFMSELFHNNMKAYNDFILRLNAISGRAEALGYLKTIAEEYKWDDGSAVVKSFYKIFDHKF